MCTIPPSEQHSIEMIGWMALPIIVFHGITARSKYGTPLIWTSLYNVAEQRHFCHNVNTLHVLPKTRHHSATKGTDGDGESDIFLAKHAFDVLARKSKSWQRLGTIVDLVLDEKRSNRCSQTSNKSLCDVGTDHGLLATGLAMTGRFDQVLGVDVSEQALREGALQLQKDILAYRNKATTNVPVQIQNELLAEFRLSDGLQNVQIGEADIVCVAGMGIHTMVDILTARRSDNTQFLLDILETRRLILQPTNSRPRLLLHLYTHLHQIGWRARTESINFVSSRWYFTVELERSKHPEIQIPGTLAMASNTSQATVNWIAHHKNWIHSDSVKTGSVHHNDELWLTEFDRVEYMV